MAEPIKSAFDTDESDELFDNFIVSDEFAERARRRRVEPEVVERVVEVVPGNALLYQDDGSIQAENFTLTKTGLIITGTMTKEEWGELGKVLKGLNQSMQWIIGDWVNYGDSKWGETYDQIANQMGLKKSTIYDYAYVAGSVHFSVRTENLSFAHHKQVAALEGKKLQRQWLEYAVENKLSVAALKREIEQQRLLANPSPAVVSEPTFMENFTQQYVDFAKQQMKSAKRVGRPERLQMAEMLRRLADQIEGLD